MKIIQKYLFLLAFTVALLGVAVSHTPKAVTPLPRFAVRNPENPEAQYISIFDGGNENYYVFLPSYADLEQVTVSLPPQQPHRPRQCILGI